MMSEKERLFHQSLSELAAQIGDNQIETKSISLLFLDLDLEFSVYEAVEINLLKYLANHNSDTVTYEGVCNAIESQLPTEKTINKFIVNRMIIGFANNYYPKLQPLAEQLKSEMGNLIYKGL